MSIRKYKNFNYFRDFSDLGYMIYLTIFFALLSQILILYILVMNRKQIKDYREILKLLEQLTEKLNRIKNQKPELS